MFTFFGGGGMLHPVLDPSTTQIKTPMRCLCALRLCTWMGVAVLGHWITADLLAPNWVGS